jgi:hypothetical protein
MVLSVAVFYRTVNRYTIDGFGLAPDFAIRPTSTAQISQPFDKPGGRAQMQS